MQVQYTQSGNLKAKIPYVKGYARGLSRHWGYTDDAWKPRHNVEIYLDYHPDGSIRSWYAKIDTSYSFTKDLSDFFPRVP